MPIVESLQNQTKKRKSIWVGGRGRGRAESWRSSLQVGCLCFFSTLESPLLFPLISLPHWWRQVKISRKCSRRSCLTDIHPKFIHSLGLKCILFLILGADLEAGKTVVLLLELCLFIPCFTSNKKEVCYLQNISIAQKISPWEEWKSHTFIPFKHAGMHQLPLVHQQLQTHLQSIW